MGTLLLSLVPSAQAVVLTEGFETCNGLTSPDSGPCATADYSYSTSSSNAFVSTTQAHTGSKSYFYAGNAATNSGTFDFTGFNLCESGSALTFWVYMDTPPATGDTNTFEVYLDGNSELQLSISDALATSFFTTEGSAGPTQIGPDMILDSWVDFTFSAECSTATGSVGSLALNFLLTSDAPGTLPNLIHFDVEEPGAPSGNLRGIFIDDFAWETGDAATAAGDRFCANPSESNFGYDYVEGVEFNDDIFTAGISLEDAFVFEGNSGNSEYLAKGYDPGTEAFLVRARLEASTEAESSKFRIAFTTGATVLTEGSGGDLTTDLAAASNGEDGGNFDDHVQIIFIENSNSWGISAWYNVGGTGLTQIAGALNYGANPNTPTTFQVVVNSGTTDLPTSVDGHTIPDIGDQVISVQDGDGSIIFQWQLPAGLFNAEWKDQWFIGKGVNAGNAFTYLDDTDQSQDDDSTCLWDLLGTGTRTGSAGLAPGSTIIDPPDEGGDGGGFSSLFDPDNIDSQLFIGFLLVAGMVFMGIRQGFPEAGIGALFFIGLFLGYALGWVPLWIILVLFVISLAAVWFLPKPSGDGV